MKKKTKALVSLESPQSLMNFGVVLKEFIVKQGLYTNIQGKNYVNVEGWQFAGGNMGLFPIVEKCEKLERQGETTYRAEVVIYHHEKIVSRGIAICSSKEAGKGNKDEYVIASMAQTRATGKAYRLIIGWLMKAAGYEATPAEEASGAQGAKTKEITAEEIGNAKKLLDKCTTKKKLDETWKKFSKELKGNNEVIAYARDIADLIVSAQKNEKQGV